MRSRCYNPNDNNYVRYGGRGISICTEWDSPSLFCEWSLNNGYMKGLEIDRIDNYSGYSPDNCRWVTRRENMRNIHTNYNLCVKGVSHCISEWAEILDIGRTTIRQWVAKGDEYASMCLEDVMNIGLKRQSGSNG